jgi:hypothetical protein
MAESNSQCNAQLAVMVVAREEQQASIFHSICAKCAVMASQMLKGK